MSVQFILQMEEDVALEALIATCRDAIFLYVQTGVQKVWLCGH